MTSTVFPLPAAGEPYVHVTSTGEWDKATRFARGADAESYLAGLAETPTALAVEVLWPDAPISFVGVVLRDDAVSGLPDLVEALLGGRIDAETAVGAMAPGGLGPIQAAECGAINAWTLVPPMTLWDGSSWHDASSLLPEHPHLRVCAYPVGLEVGHRHAWYAVEVSRHTDDGHVIDEDLLVDLSGRVQQGISRQRA